MNKREMVTLIDKERVINLLQEYVRTPSVSGEEQELAEKVKKTCSEIGMDAEIDKHGNVIASYKWPKPGPRVNLNAHLDTVGYGEGWTRDPLGAELEGDLMYGRGSADTKASLVAQILGTKALIDANLPLGGEVAITHVVEEEVQNASRKGTVKLLKDGFTADMAINGEATDMKICVACEGMLEILFTTLGRRAHGSNPKEGINAIVQMCKIIDELGKLQPGYNKYTGYGSIVPGVINGGERSSVVPDVCELKVSRFTVPGETAPLFYSQALGIIERLKREDPTFDARAELLYDSNPSLVAEDEPVVKGMIAAFQDAFGLETVELSGTPQHDDADWLTNIGGIPTVIFGPGQIKVGHIPDEYVDTKEVVKATEVYALTLYNLLGGA